MDKHIGKDAERRWSDYKERSQEKKRVREKSGQMELGRKSDGTYVPLSENRLRNRGKAYEKFEHAKKTGIKIEHDDGT